MTVSALAPSDRPMPPRVGFAAMMREGTAAIHRQAERAGFIADLIRNRATRQGYALFLRNLVPAYEALEHALARHVDTPVLAAFADPRLRRLPALLRDIEAIEGDGWPAILPLLPAAEAYAGAITEAARGTGLRLVAQAYARYLGDLSGGQILKPLLGRTLALGPDALGFYDFPGVTDVTEPKTAMRDALDAIPVTSADATLLVEEANEAFRHNIAVSMAVQAALA